MGSFCCRRAGVGRLVVSSAHVQPAWRTALLEGRTAVWFRPTVSGTETVSEIMPPSEVEAARRRFERFAAILANLVPANGWDGRIRSPLLDFAAPEGGGTWLVKGDHALPMTGSIKARGGVHELLCIIERLAEGSGVSIDQLRSPDALALFARHTVVVASTGNLGYSIGLVARAFGLAAEVHMSADAKQWKKDRLRLLGVTLVEHDCDYSETIALARKASSSRANSIFIDDEGSRDLLAGYAVAADELVEQLTERRIVIGPSRLLVVYLPCGVGGAPGGITYGLKRRFGTNVVIVFAEPTASPCLLVALASGGEGAPSVYDFGCDNNTIADGLAVPRASELVLSVIGNAIDAAVAVPDTAMLDWLRAAWRSGGLKLEPSAAAAFAAYGPFTAAAREQPDWPVMENAVHVFWATGGSQVPEADFLALLGEGAGVERS